MRHSPFRIACWRRPDRRGEQRFEQGRFAEHVCALDPETQELRSDRVAVGESRKGRPDQGEGRAGLPLGALERCRLGQRRLFNYRRFCAGGEG